SGTTQANIEARALQSEAAEVGQQEARALESSKVKGASEAPVNEARALQSEAPVNARGLQNETAEVGQSVKALESEADVRALESQTPVKVQDEAGQSGGSETLPTKTKLERELSPQEIHEVISKWDLKNPSPKDRLLIGRVQGEELEQLAKEFKFKGNYALAREIDAQHVAHALNRHSNISVETSRNQIPITLEDITNYPNIIKNAEVREVERDSIVYKKQINGHYVVVEEALTSQNKIRFVTMWKSKGTITTPPTPSSKGYDLDRTLSGSYDKPNPTTPPLKSQEFKAKATELYNIAKAQEIEFKEFLENLKSANNSLELGQILKSEASIESKIARKQGDISAISDYLRAAIISKDKTHLDTELVRLEDSLKSRGIKPTIELHHRDSGYKGVHVQFEFNGVPSEIQLHTVKSWRIKKRLDPLYHELREHEIKNTLTPEEVENIRAASRQLGQDSDLDIKALTSFAVKSDSASNSEKSVLVRKSATDLNLTQQPLEKSNSYPPSVVDLDVKSNAYNRPDSTLSEKSNFSGGKGKIESSIDKPLSSSIQATQSPLKSQEPKLLPYKRTSEIYKEAKAKGLSY
uniref:PBECR3 domain-containing polyvalent protein n=1 Tax=Helicobacter suis TaxID=104628 RepID=UPI001F08166D